MMPEIAEVIAVACCLPADVALPLLEEMAHSGSITDVRRKSPAAIYGGAVALEFREYQGNRLTPELAQDVSRYLNTAWRADRWREAPHLRTIPIGASLAAAYEGCLSRRRKDAGWHTRFAVAPCIGREDMIVVWAKVAQTAGNLPGDGLRCRSVSASRACNARSAKRKRCKSWSWQTVRPVLQPGNAQNANNICCCCGYCCGVLRTPEAIPSRRP